MSDDEKKILIRNVPPKLHESLTKAASAAGMSMNKWLLERLGDLVEGKQQQPQRPPPVRAPVDLPNRFTYLVGDEKVTLGAPLQSGDLIHVGGRLVFVKNLIHRSATEIEVSGTSFGLTEGRVGPTDGGLITRSEPV